MPARSMAAAVCLVLAQAAQAQSLPDSYARVTALLNFMTTYVGEVLLGCAEKNVLTEDQAEARFKAYRERNTALLERAEAWSREAEARLGTARRQGDQAGLGAVAEASTRAQGEVGTATDVRAFCAARLAAIESGNYDLSVNRELVDLLKTRP